MKQLLLSLLLTLVLTSCQTEEEFETPKQQAEVPLAETAENIEADTKNEDDKTNGEEGSNEDPNNQSNQENQNNEEKGITVVLLTDILLKNTWTVDNLTQKKGLTAYIDRTSKLSGFTFVFKDSGKVIAEADNTVVDGSWTITGNEKEGLILMLDFDTKLADFVVLNNNWPIVSLSNTSMGYVHGNLNVAANADNRVFLSFDKAK
ncbi:hypothetical protein [Cellulophaga omnivescoria]|uniref:hypothetical protein n=1 Tax=Cellulophaga omnivescoria TaxID=1888890 RepID=UPI000986CD24|nr:hypothetical protein [Cellulophaga omnivescoria]WBU87896.1 hypothetical protein PBN93_08420 [Cellulophaga omnivescoria]